MNPETASWLGGATREQQLCVFSLLDSVGFSVFWRLFAGCRLYVLEHYSNPPTPFPFPDSPPYFQIYQADSTMPPAMVFGSVIRDCNIRVLWQAALLRSDIANCTFEPPVSVFLPCQP